jgi:hypothetical protein
MLAFFHPLWYNAGKSRESRFDLALYTMRGVDCMKTIIYDNPPNIRAWGLAFPKLFYRSEANRRDIAEKFREFLQSNETVLQIAGDVRLYGAAYGRYNRPDGEDFLSSNIRVITRTGDTLVFTVISGNRFIASLKDCNNDLTKMINDLDSGKGLSDISHHYLDDLGARLANHKKLYL